MKGLLQPLWLAGLLAPCLTAQHSYTWQELLEKFERANPTLQAAEASIAESRASEITAHLRPNPDCTLSGDGLQLTPNQGVWRPLGGIVRPPGLSYLSEPGDK